MFEKEAEEKYCKGCKLRMEQCLWAWRNTNGLNEPNEKNCSCKEVPAYIKGAEFGYNKANEWHLLKDGYPEINKLVRVRTFSGMEYVCTTEWYYPTEDEIGYGHALFSFYTLNDDWIDENEIKSWCELQPVPKEFE